MNSTPECMMVVGDYTSQPHNFTDGHYRRQADKAFAEISLHACHTAHWKGSHAHHPASTVIDVKAPSSCVPEPTATDVDHNPMILPLFGTVTAQYMLAPATACISCMLGRCEPMSCATDALCPAQRHPCFQQPGCKTAAAPSAMPSTTTQLDALSTTPLPVNSNTT